MIHWFISSAAQCPATQAGATPPSFLSTKELETYAAFRFAKRRREWLLGRWCAKQLLRLSGPAYDMLPLEAITVANDPDGAPYLRIEGQGRLPSSLSISHRDERAFCALCFFANSGDPSAAIAPAGELVSIGADVERIEARDVAFIQDFFTSGEAEFALAAASPLRDLLVTVTWSAKESVLKALRLGLSVDTRRVQVLNLGRIKLNALPMPGKWQSLQIWSQLPGTSQMAAWWATEETYVYTLASTRLLPLAPVPYWHQSGENVCPHE